MYFFLLNLHCYFILQILLCHDYLSRYRSNYQRLFRGNARKRYGFDKLISFAELRYYVYRNISSLFPCLLPRFSLFLFLSKYQRLQYNARVSFAGNYSERIIMSFSLRRTIKALLKEATDDTDITCIHGIRALAAIAVYATHKLLTVCQMPFSNRTFLTEVRSLRRNPSFDYNTVTYLASSIELYLNRSLTVHSVLFCADSRLLWIFSFC